MTLYEAISVRISTRSFDGAEVPPEKTEELRRFLDATEREDVRPPFGNHVRFALCEAESKGKPIKMGTYGLIAGASGFVVPAIPRTGKLAGAMEDTGWVVEKVVLELTALGYASCWIGGVFSRGRAEEIVTASRDEIVPAIVAFGWPSDKRKIADRIVTASARVRVRKPLESIVFRLSETDYVDAVHGVDWKVVTAAVREAPSASNKQPWRLVRLRDEKRWLLFIDEDKIYNNSMRDVHLQNLDLGIAMRHFHLAAEAQGLHGSWTPVTHLQANTSDMGLKEALAFGRKRGWSPCTIWA